MYKLLLVDDEAIIREGIEKMVDWGRLGICLTDSCANAIVALDSMMDDMPDILVTDVRMPGMDGLELVERPVASEGGNFARHDPDKLAAAVLEIYRQRAVRIFRGKERYIIEE
mgnify:CR=1 FL=1